MKRSTVRFLLSVASVAALASCGGGGDESGSPTAFSIVPDTFTIEGDPPAPGSPAGTKGTCAVGGPAVEVFVYGGTAPFRIDNTLPAYVSINKQTVQHKGESFSLTFLGGCFDAGKIAVVDSLDNQVVLTLTNKPGEN